MSKMWISPRNLLVGLVVLSLLSWIPGAAVAQEDPTIRLQVATPEYVLDDTGVTVPGYTAIITPGAPQLPVYGSMIELPLTGDWDLSFEDVGSLVLDTLVDVPAVPVPQWPDGASDAATELPDGIPVTDQPDPAIYQANAFYPSSVVEWGKAQRDGDRRIVPVRVYPFQYNPVTRQLRYHPDVRVTVTVDQSAPPVQPSEPRDLYQPKRDPQAMNSAGALRIRTGARGLYRLTYSDLQAAFVPDGVNPATFAMSNEGQPIDIQIIDNTASPGTFDDGDLVVFYAVPYEGRWQNHNVYWFYFGGAVSTDRIVTRGAATTPGTPTIVITQSLAIEHDIEYAPGSPLRGFEDDHWLGERLTATPGNPSSLTYSLSLDDPIQLGTVRFEGRLHRGSQQTYNPDNSMAVYLNTDLIGTFQWDGQTDVEAFPVVTRPASFLSTVSNQLRFVVDTTQIPGIPRLNSLIDWVKLSYPADANAENDNMYIEAVAPGTTSVQVTGFTTDQIRVYDVRNPQSPVQLTSVQAQAADLAYTIRFWDDNVAGPTYYLSSQAALAAPLVIEPDAPSSWGVNTNRADYIAIIGSSRLYDSNNTIGQALSAAIEPLLNYHRNQADPLDRLRVAKVDVQDIYDEFSFGIADPQAIRDFFGYAYWNWNQGEPSRPGYGLLVGDGTYDFTRVSSTTLLNLLPPYLLRVDPFFGEVPTDSRFVSVDGPDDYLPNMAIARISAQSATDVTFAVTKILAYEASADGAWQSQVAFGAGKCYDDAGNLQAATNTIKNMLPAGYQSSVVYYHEATTPANTCPGANAAGAGQWDILARNQFNDGVLMFQWLGHGSQLVWGGGPDFRRDDIQALQPNTVWPLTAHYACNTGYFISISGNDQSFGEDFLQLSSTQGSAADLSGAGLHTVSAMQIWGQKMIQSLFIDRNLRIGDAVKIAKQYYYSATPSFHDVIDTMTLFGDPAMKIRLPAPLLAGSTVTTNREWAPAGTPLTVDATISNTGAASSSNTQMTTTLPAELGDPIDLTASSGVVAYDPASRQVTWTGNVNYAMPETVAFTSIVSPTVTACTEARIATTIEDDLGQVTSLSATFNVTVPDVNCSSSVDILDLQLVASHWNTMPADPFYHPRYDLDGDDGVTINDLIIAAENWN